MDNLDELGKNVGTGVLSVSVTLFSGEKKRETMRKYTPVIHENSYYFESLFYSHAYQLILYIITNLTKYQPPTDNTPLYNL